MKALETKDKDNYRILIIDDNNDIHSDFQKVLVLKKGNDSLEKIASALFGQESVNKKQNADIFNDFQLDFASQGEEGYQKVLDSVETGNPYAMAFVDIRMPPGWNGVETVKKIWDIDPNLEIVFCSAYSDFSLRDIYEKLINKHNEFLIIKKPFDIVEVKQAAASMCQIWNLKRKLENRIEEVEEQLLQADKLASIGQLAAGVAHEINNPIGYINSNICTLQDYVKDLLSLISTYQTYEKAEGDKSRFLLEIDSIKKEIDLDFLKDDVLNLISESLEGVERVKRIIQDLREFSHRGGSDWEAYDLNEGVRRGISILQSEIIPLNILVETGFSNLPKIRALGSQIDQVILNILINAIHAMQNGGKLSIETSVVGEEVKLNISDTGSGIPSKIVGKIFDPFFTTKPVGKGVGLGLYLSYGIIKKHQGKIEVKSEINKGATFTIILPIGDERQMDVGENVA